MWLGRKPFFCYSERLEDFFFDSKSFFSLFFFLTSWETLFFSAKRARFIFQKRIYWPLQVGKAHFAIRFKSARKFIAYFSIERLFLRHDTCIVYFKGFKSWIAAEKIIHVFTRQNIDQFWKVNKVECDTGIQANWSSRKPLIILLQQSCWF